MLNGTVERRYLMGAGQSVSLTNCCADAPAHSHHSLGILRGVASFIALQDDPDYRRAIADADLAIAASGWAVLFWSLIQR